MPIKKDGEKALEDIDLDIKSGETIGIIGGTGSAKSSLVQLLPRLYDVTEGSVTIGGVDVRRYDLDTLRNNVAMVLQKNELFSGTIAENLRWGNPTPPTPRSRTPASRPAPMNLSSASPTSTRPTSSRAATTFPAARSSASALPAHC